jgi:Na+-transporting NADH:ubiquinone oxidoreductase subunit NqrA
MLHLLGLLDTNSRHSKWPLNPIRMVPFKNPCYIEPGLLIHSLNDPSTASTVPRVIVRLTSKVLILSLVTTPLSVMETRINNGDLDSFVGIFPVSSHSSDQVIHFIEPVTCCTFVFTLNL